MVINWNKFMTVDAWREPSGLRTLSSVVPGKELLMASSLPMYFFSLKFWHSNTLLSPASWTASFLALIIWSFTHIGPNTPSRQVRVRTFE